MFLKMGVCGLHIFYGYIPLFVLLYERFFVAGSEIADRDVTLELCYSVSFFAAVFFYATNTPERFRPGK